MMIEAAVQRGVRVLLLTLPVNYRLSPAWKHPQPEAMQPANQSAIRETLRRADVLYRRGEFATMAALVEDALAREPEAPLLHYLRGAALERMGRLAEAECAYERSRECMIGNLGSCLSINERIRKVARETRVELVDVKQLFDDHQHARGRYFNEDLIADDCHPTPAGHRLILEALADRLAASD